MLEESHALRQTSLRLLLLAMAFEVVIAILEGVIGALEGSVALLGDAGHNLSHLIAFGLAWIGVYVSKRPPNSSYTWGFQRTDVLAGFCSSLLLIGMSGAVFFGAVIRLFHPADPAPGPLVVVSIVDLTVDLGFAWLFARRSSLLAMKTSFWHLVGDAAASLAVLFAGVVIFFTGWHVVDPLAAGIIALIMCRQGMRLISEATRILLEGVPYGLDRGEIQRAIEEFRGVERVQNLHIQALSADPASTTLSAHVFLQSSYVYEQEIGEELAAMLKKRFGIHHTTFQIHPPSFWPYSRYVRE